MKNCNGCSCHCRCGAASDEIPEYRVNDGHQELTLAELPVGTTATIVKILPHMRGRKKFADVGLVAGSELVMEAHAPFGGLIRVRVMEASMAMHRDDAANVVLKKEE
ncbi:MAG: ferrous iron transport protein A [Victivallaceae bacterium]|nr:FeoA family protein [Victivallaceae bacterium]